MPLLVDSILRLYFKYRQQQIDKVLGDPVPYQQKILKQILARHSASEYGKKYGFGKLTGYKDFAKAVPIVKYEEIVPHVQNMMSGAKNILVTDKVSWFAKSSGTANGRSKYIPVTKHYLTQGHLKCTWTSASVIYNEDPTARLFADKNLIMAGSLEQRPHDIRVGDISAIMLHHFPQIGRRFATPSFEVALIPDWEEKIRRVAEIASKERVTLLGGVPTWTIVLFKEILRQTGAANISEVWPHLKTYMHGGVGFDPFREEFRQYLPSKDVTYREVYNATEGYFALQNEKDVSGMSLLCDHQIFYEFIPKEKELECHAHIIPLEEVEIDKDYIIVITNSAGLYRYKMGDLVRFVSLAPYKIKVVGRTEQYLNVFGEELMISNTDAAITAVSRTHGVSVRDYSVAPRYMDSDINGRHDWVIEFNSPLPDSLASFEQDLDAHLRFVNSDYDAKRYRDIALSPLKIHVLQSGTVDQWLRQNNKYGGQNKLTRLSNDRLLLDKLLAFSEGRLMHQ